MFKINKLLSNSILNKISILQRNNIKLHTSNLSSLFNKQQINYFSNKNEDLKNKQGISDEQVKIKKEEEEKRLKEEERKSKLKYEEDSQKLKDKFSKLKSGMNDEIEIDLGKIKQKFTSFLYSKKKKEEVKVNVKDEIKEKDKEDSKEKFETKESMKEDPLLKSTKINMEKENINQTQDQTQKEKTEEKAEDNTAKSKTEEKKKAPLFKNKQINKFIAGFKDLWNKTFPGEENVELIMQARKNKAKLIKSLIKEPTEEEILEVKFLFI